MMTNAGYRQAAADPRDLDADHEGRENPNGLFTSASSRARNLHGMSSRIVHSLRIMPTRRLLVTCCAFAAVTGSVTAIALAAGGSGTVPPARPLAAAVHDALAAPEVQGITARIEFTNKLIDSSAVQGSDPLLSGATGRIWIGSDHRFRLELQSERGDAQIVSDGRTLSVYDASTNAAYRAELPREPDKRRPAARRVPTIADIQNELDRLVRHLGVSSAAPSTVAGRPAYTVRVSPRRDGGLVGGAELAWDAARGIPLRVAVYATGNDSPVLELKATDIAFGAVPDSRFAATPPAGAKLTEIARRAPRRDAVRRGHPDPVRGIRAVSRALPFSLSAPGSLAGMRRSGVRLLDWGAKPAVLVTYGDGLGGLAVIERVADHNADQRRAAAPLHHGERTGLSLPSIDLAGTKGRVLPTALGTMISFERAGVAYAVVGSVRQSVAETAARGL